jgi:hypothetical protein
MSDPVASLRAAIRAQFEAMLAAQAQRRAGGPHTGTIDNVRRLLRQRQYQGLGAPRDLDPLGPQRAVRYPPERAQPLLLLRMFEHGFGGAVEGDLTLFCGAALAAYYAGLGTEIPYSDPARFEHIFGQASASAIQSCLSAQVPTWPDGPPSLGAMVEHATLMDARVDWETGALGVPTGLTMLADQGLRMAGRSWIQILPESWAFYGAAMYQIGVQRDPEGGYWLFRAGQTELEIIPLTVDPVLSCIVKWRRDSEVSEPGATMMEAGLLGYATLDPSVEPIKVMDISTTGWSPSHGWQWRYQRGNDAAGAIRSTIAFEQDPESSDPDVGEWRTRIYTINLTWLEEGEWEAELLEEDGGLWGQVEEGFLTGRGGFMLRIPAVPNDLTRLDTVPLWPLGRPQPTEAIVYSFMTPEGRKDLINSGYSSGGDLPDDPDPGWPEFCAAGSGTTERHTTVSHSWSGGWRLGDVRAEREAQIKSDYVIRSADVSVAGELVVYPSYRFTYNGKDYYGYRFSLGGPCHIFPRTCPSDVCESLSALSYRKEIRVNEGILPDPSYCATEVIRVEYASEETSLSEETTGQAQFQYGATYAVLLTRDTGVMLLSGEEQRLVSQETNHYKTRANPTSYKGLALTWWDERNNTEFQYLSFNGGERNVPSLEGATSGCGDLVDEKFGVGYSPDILLSTDVESSGETHEWDDERFSAYVFLSSTGTHDVSDSVASTWAGLLVSTEEAARACPDVSSTYAGRDFVEYEIGEWLVPEGYMASGPLPAVGGV